MDSNKQNMRTPLQVFLLPAGSLVLVQECVSQSLVMHKQGEIGSKVAPVTSHDLPAAVTVCKATQQPSFTKTYSASSYLPAAFGLIGSQLTFCAVGQWRLLAEGSWTKIAVAQSKLYYAAVELNLWLSVSEGFITITRAWYETGRAGGGPEKLEPAILTVLYRFITGEYNLVRCKIYQLTNLSQKTFTESWHRCFCISWLVPYNTVISQGRHSAVVLQFRREQSISQRRAARWAENTVSVTMESVKSVRQLRSKARLVQCGPGGAGQRGHPGSWQEAGPVQEHVQSPCWGKEPRDGEWGERLKL